MAGLSYGSLLRDTEVDESENKSLVSVMRIGGSQPRVPSLYVFLFSSAFWKTLGWHKSNFNKCTTVLFWQLQEEAPGTLTCQVSRCQNGWITAANNPEWWEQILVSVQIKPHGGDVYHLHRLVFKNDCVWKTATKRHLFTFFFFSLSSNVNVYLISSYVVILNIFSVFSSV